MRELQNKFKAALNSAKTLPERFLSALARYYITKYKERLKRGLETNRDEDLLFAYAIEFVNKGA